MQGPKVASVTDPMVDSMVSALRAFIEALPRRRTMTNAQYEGCTARDVARRRRSGRTEGWCREAIDRLSEAKSGLS